MLQREICSERDRAFSMSNAQERFRNFRLQQEYDTHDPKGLCSSVLPLLRNSSKIIEIVAAHDIVFALAQSGICAAFSRDTNERICCLNVSSDEEIRSLFYNKTNDSLITVSVYASDNFSLLKCRTTRIEYIKRGKPDEGFALFESESLKWPGFVEFDDVNEKVLTYSAQDSVYKVFDLKNYTLLYSVSDENVLDIKLSPGIMLLIFNKEVNHIPMKILSIEDGTVLKSFSHPIHQNKKVDFFELLNEKLLLKQEKENLQILDVQNSELREVSGTEFMTPSAFAFLHKNQLLLTFKNRAVSVWNCRGNSSHLLKIIYCGILTATLTRYTSQLTKILLSRTAKQIPTIHCPKELVSFLAAGSINVSNILTGKCLAKIKVDKCLLVEETSGGSNSNPRRRTHAASLRSTSASEDVTALFYDEERNEIYTGNRHGLVHVWSN